MIDLSDLISKETLAHVRARALANNVGWKDSIYGQQPLTNPPKPYVRLELPISVAGYEHSGRPDGTSVRLQFSAFTLTDGNGTEDIFAISNALSGYMNSFESVALIVIECEYVGTVYRRTADGGHMAAVEFRLTAMKG